MSIIVALTQQQIDSLKYTPASVLVGEKLSSPLASASFAMLQYRNPVTTNHTLSDIRQSEVLSMNNGPLKEVYHAIATHLSLTNLPFQKTDTELLKKIIYPHIHRLAELKSHPDFAHLKGIVGPEIDGKRLVFVFQPQFLHSPANLKLHFESDAKKLDDLNSLFSQSRRNQEFESMLNDGFLNIGKKPLNEFLTALSRVFLTKPLTFSQAGLADALAKSRGAWLLKHLPPSML